MTLTMNGRTETYRAGTRSEVPAGTVPSGAPGLPLFDWRALKVEFASFMAGQPPPFSPKHDLGTRPHGGSSCWVFEGPPPRPGATWRPDLRRRLSARQPAARGA